MENLVYFQTPKFAKRLGVQDERRAKGGG